MRLSGRNLTETEEVKLGAYHTLELEPQRAFTLAKVHPLAGKWHGLKSPLCLSGRHADTEKGTLVLQPGSGRDVQLMPWHLPSSVPVHCEQC